MAFDLRDLVGTWDGTYRLWLTPDELTSEGPTHASGELVVPDSVALLRYDWASGDDRHEGTMLLAGHDDRHELAWADTFHTAGGILWSTGGPDPVVLGTYQVGDASGEWRTEFAMADADHLVVTAWNIWEGYDYKATEAVYERS